MLATGPRTDNINPYNAMKRWSVEATDSMIHLMCGYVYDWCPWLLSMLVKGWQGFFDEVINCSDGLIPEVTGAFSVMFSPFPLVSVSLFFCSFDFFAFFFSSPDQFVTFTMFRWMHTNVADCSEAVTHTPGRFFWKNENLCSQDVTFCKADFWWRQQEGGSVNLWRVQLILWKTWLLVCPIRCKFMSLSLACEISCIT